MISESPSSVSKTDDPRRLRDLLGRAQELAAQHDMCSVLVGLSGFEGDVDFPEIVDFIVSALRIDDAVFRMTRERAILLLTDVDESRATEIVSRLLWDYRERFPSLSEPAVGTGFFEVGPRSGPVAVRDVLPQIFASPPKRQ
jgi:hypothetical protein